MTTVEELDRQIRSLLPVTRIECTTTSTGRSKHPTRAVLTVTLVDGSKRVQEARTPTSARNVFLRRLPANPRKLANGWNTSTPEETRLAERCGPMLKELLETLDDWGPLTDKGIAANSSLNEANAQKRATEARSQGLIEYAGHDLQNFKDGPWAGTWRCTTAGLILIGVIVEPTQLTLEAS